MDDAALKHIVPVHDAPWISDTTFYPVEEKVGEDILQRWIVEMLRPLVERWFALTGKEALVGADQFIYFKRFHPDKVVAPDLYVLPGVPPSRRIKTWKVWKTGIVPSFALEVVASNDEEKDYREVVDRYTELGVDELIIFDPDHHLDEDRVRWQRYCKRKGRGFVLVARSDGDRMRSSVLGCYLRVVGEGDAARLRLGTGPRGEQLVPTAAEAERAAKEAALAAKEAALAAKEQERTAKEAALAAKEQERMAKEAALARVAELEALLAKRQRAPRRK